MKKMLIDIDLQIMQIRYQLLTYRNFVSPSDIKDGYTVEELRRKLRSLEKARQTLLLSYRS